MAKKSVFDYQTWAELEKDDPQRYAREFSIVLRNVIKRLECDLKREKSALASLLSKYPLNKSRC